MEQAQKQAKEQNAFFGMTKIPVRLTYQFTDPATVITFYCKMALADDDKAARQSFYSQPDADQARGLHAYYVDLLVRVTVAKPDGLPGFDEFLQNYADKELPSELKKAMQEFFADASSMKVKVVADAIEQYNRITQPVEFFR